MISFSAIVVAYKPDPVEFHGLIKRLCEMFSEVLIFENEVIDRSEIEDFCSENVKIRYYKSTINFGLHSAQNYLISKVSKETEYVVFFDQDSYPNSTFLKDMKGCYDELINSGEVVGCIGPELLDGVSWKKMNQARKLGFLVSQVEEKTQNAQRVDFVINSGMMIKYSLLKKVGKIDEELFVNFGDIDLCLRINMLGYGCYYNSKAKLLHHVGRSRVRLFGRSVPIHGPERMYFLTRNALLMLNKKYINLGFKIRLILSIPIRLFIALYFSQKNERIRYLKSWYRGFLSWAKREKYGNNQSF